MFDSSWIGNYSYFRARLDSEGTAVVELHTGKKYSYGDLDRRANILANFLKKDFGIEKDDRVAFISSNRIELIDAYFATGKSGTIMVPYNARLSVEELEKLMESEKPKLLFFEEEYINVAESLKAAGVVKELVVLADKPVGSAGAYEDIMRNGDDTPASCPELDMEDIHMIIHTGGTTGLPKGGLISHRAEIFNSFNEICTWGLHYADKALILLPLFHTGGWHLLTLPLLHAGACIYINKQYDPDLTLKVVEEEKITLLFGAATIFRMLAEREAFALTDFSSLKWVMAGAAPTPINIMKMFWNKGVKFVLGYGMTEAGPNNISSVAHFMSPELIRKKYASVGKPMYLSLAKLVDDDGNVVDTPNTPGEIHWSGPQIFSGYWGNKEETEATLVDGWIHSGDMATFDEDGFYYIVGRKKNMFISGGENVFPPEIEKALYDIEEVKETCVFGVPDEKWGEVGKAIVSLKPGASIDKQGIIQKLSGKLAKYKIPKYITFVDDVPKNSVGKIVVSEVQKQFGESKD